MFDGKTDISLPDWIETGAKPAEGLDLLGLRNPVQRISNSLLTGITTITPQIRYLTFRAWIIKTYIDFRLPDDYRSFVDFASRMECAIVLANVLTGNKTTGLVGRTKATELISKDPATHQLIKLVDQIATTIYQNPSVQLGIAFQDNEAKITGLTLETGMKLAQCFGKRIEETDFFASLSRNHRLDRVSRESLLQLAKLCPLDEIPGDEQSILIDTLFPSNRRIGKNRNIASSLATYVALLEIARSRRRVPTEEDLFLASMRPRPGLSDMLHPILDGWLLYTVRDMIAAVHECGLEEVTKELERQSTKMRRTTIRNVIRGLLRRSGDIDELLKKLGLLNRHESYSDISIRTINGRIEKRISHGRTTNHDLVRWTDDTFNEIAIYENALGSPGSIGLLPIAWLLGTKRISQASKGRHRLRDLVEEGEWWRMGIPQIIQPSVESWLKQDHTLQIVIGELITKTIDQHLKITWERNFADPDKDVSLFTADADRLTLRKSFQASRTASRLNEAIGWLLQLQLVGDQGLTDSGVKTLKSGQATLESFQDEEAM